MKYPLALNCTRDRAKALGVDAIVNARSGMAHLNAITIEGTELMRDGQCIKDCLQHRIRFYHVNSKFFRRNRSRIEHLISSYND